MRRKNSVDPVIEDIENTKYEISRLRQLLDNITDHVLTDRFIFELKANEERFRYLYRLAKSENISSDRYMTPPPAAQDDGEASVGAEVSVK